MDLNVLPAWQLGFNGSGMRVAINDDGMDLTHPDLRTNIEASSVYDTNRGTTGSGFVGSENQHGTVVGAIVGMASNDIGGVGIAYRSTLIPGLVSTAGTNALANLFAANLTARADVSVNSWGADPAFAENFGVSGSQADQAWGEQLIRNATLGRNGLGMVTEVSAGNERSNNADSALSNFTNNKVTISVAATDEHGVVTNYSTPGASNLIAAFGGTTSDALDQSINRGFGIAAADIQGASGYNTTAGAAGDYSYQNTGTSYSGPMVGAAAALILQANPNLGFRDVATILAMTARQTDSSNLSWITNGASDWNGVGMHFSRDYGFGLLDISAAVRLAQSWVNQASTFSNWTASSGSATAASQQIPDSASQSLVITARLNEAIQIERVEVDLNLTALAPSQLKGELTSPAGTTITLFNRPLTRDIGASSSESERPWPESFTIGVTGFLGETSSGTWTLRLTDLVSGITAQFNSATVRAWGSTVSTDNQYVFTNEYSRSHIVSDASGTDTLNAAAVSQSVRLDLSRGTQSQIANTVLTINSSTVIENAIGGAANDILIGNSVTNRLRGNEGNDTIDGGAGTDTAVYSSSRGDYSIVKTGGNFTVTDRTGAYGTDLLTNIEVLQFSNITNVLAPTNSTTQHVALLYKGALNRTPDAGGLAGWIDLADRLPGGTSNLYNLSDLSGNYNGALSIAAGFTYSTEFVQRYGLLTNDQFVTQLYSNILDRRPDTAGLNAWVSELNGGTTRERVLVGFALSGEAISNATNGFTGQTGTVHDPWMYLG